MFSLKSTSVLCGVVAVGLEILSGAKSAEAQADYFASAGSDMHQGPTTVTAVFDFARPTTQDENGIASLHSFATAGPNGLTGSSRATLSANHFNPAPPANGDNIGGGTTSSLTLNDVIISGPGSGTVNISTRLSLSGAFSTNVFFSGMPNIVAASANLDVFVTVSYLVAGVLVTHTFDGGLHQGNINGVVSRSSYGSLADHDVTGPATTPNVTVPLNSPFTLSLELDTSASTIVQAPNSPEFALQLDALSDFTHTLTFATT
jgi:hypothetical protein